MLLVGTEINDSSTDEDCSNKVGITEIQPMINETLIKRGAKDTKTTGQKSPKTVSTKRRHNKIALRNATFIAMSLKRRIELEEEQNALQAFSINECITEEHKAERREFMELTRKSHLQRVRSSMNTPQPATPTSSLVPTDHVQQVPSFPSSDSSSQWLPNLGNENFLPLALLTPPPLPPSV